MRYNPKFKSTVTMIRLIRLLLIYLPSYYYTTYLITLFTYVFLA